MGLNCGVRTVRRDIKALAKRGVIVPTRGHKLIVQYPVQIIYQDPVGYLNNVCHIYWNTP